jgi:hypothetical protein
VSHITCENCHGAQATCRRCGGPWSKNTVRGGKSHHCPGRFRATPKTFRVLCGGRHFDFKCDRCGSVAEGDAQYGYSYPRRPVGWSDAAPPGHHLTSIELCGSCSARHAVAFDAAMSNEDASKLDEAINRVESIACGWAFDLGVKWPRTVLADAAGGFIVPPNLRESVMELIRSDGRFFRAPFPSTVALGRSATTPSQQIEQEDGEYNREEYR